MRFPKRALLLAPVFVLAVVVAAVPTVALGRNEKDFRARLNGYNETPSVNTNGTGTVRVHLDDATQTITFRLEYSGLTGNPAVAHIHLGQQHVAGGVMVFFCGGGGQPTCPASTSGTVEGKITKDMVVGPAAQGIDPSATNPGAMGAVFAAIRNNAAYANVHTAKFPAGEIRGQLRARD